MNNLKNNKETAKQIFLSVIAITLIGIGYANYTFNNTIGVASRESSNEINLGDVELVSSTPVKENLMQDIVSNDTLQENENVSPNYIQEDTTNYFEETRIQRDRMYSETLETYQKLVDSNQTPQEQKAIAAQEISNIAIKKNSIIIAENLIKNKGFDNVVILENNGSVSVIVKSKTLNADQISKIQNIIERELNVDVANINISNK